MYHASRYALHYNVSENLKLRDSNAPRQDPIPGHMIPIFQLELSDDRTPLEGDPRQPGQPPPLSAPMAVVKTD